MKIDMQGFDLSGFLEAHRDAVLGHFEDNAEGQVLIAHAHDRATTKCLLAVIQGQAPSTPATLPVVNGGVAAGSKAARDRAKKAARTRKANLAAAANTAAGNMKVEDRDDEGFGGEE